MALSRRGIVLIAAVMLVVFASIAVLGVTTFIVQRLSQNQTNILRAKCLYLAQAGYNYAIYYYRANGTFPSGQVSIDANNYFVLNVTSTGTQAEALLVDPSASYLANSNKDVRGVTIRNTSGTAIAIDRIIVTWSLATGRSLRQIRIQTTTYNFNLSSPADADLSPDFSLSPGTTYSIQRFRFNRSMLQRIIWAQFVMADGSMTENIRIYPSSPAQGGSGGNIFTIKSTGKTTGSNIYRSVQATFNTTTGKITEYHEIPEQITP